MSILERTLYVFRRSLSILARNTEEKRYVILYVLLRLDYNNKIFTTIYKDNIPNKFNNWTKREHYLTHMFGDLIL